jgi:GNAT superfamily N-acetyltransferase
MTDIRIITAQDTLACRQSVLWPDKPLSHVMLTGDDNALHLGVFIDDQLIGVGSFFSDGTKARLRKLAILPAHQKKGLGATIVQRGVDLLGQDGVTLLWCDARESAQKFYANLGFTISGNVFYKSGVAYVIAERDLTDPQ